MAQGSSAGFGLGTDDKHIATVDAAGVALAAMQGLNQKVEEHRKELKQKQSEIADLQQRLAGLEMMMQQLASHPIESKTR